MVPKCTLQHPQWCQNVPSEGPKRGPKLMWNSNGAPGCSKGSSGVCSTIWSSILIADCWLDPQLWSLIANLPQFQFQSSNLWPLGVESRGPKGVSICRGGSPTFWEKWIIFLNSFLGQLVCDLKSFLGPSGRPCGAQKAQHGQALTFPMSIWKVNSRWILTISNLVFFFKEKTFFGSKRPFRATFAGT